MKYNFNDDNTNINLNDFSVTSQDNFVTFDDLYILSHDNDDIEEFTIPTDFTPTTNSGNIEVELQEKVKDGFKFSACNILNNVGSLMTRNRYGIKGSRYVNHHINNYALLLNVSILIYHILKECCLLLYIGNIQTENYLLLYQ